MHVSELTDRKAEVKRSKTWSAGLRPGTVNPGLPAGKSGAPARTRTWDQLIKSQLLYQLSYRGNQFALSDFHSPKPPHFSCCIPLMYPARSVQRQIEQDRAGPTVGFQEPAKGGKRIKHRSRWQMEKLAVAAVAAVR